MSMRFFTLITALVLLCSGCGSVPPAGSQAAEFSSPEVSAADVPALPDPSAPVEPAVHPIPAPLPTDAVPNPAPQKAPSPPAPVPPAEVSAPAPIPPVEIPSSGPVPAPQTPDVPVYESNVPTIHIPDPVPTDPAYDFSVPVAEGSSVGVDYFSDAAFVGDSRTEGFWLYSGVKQGKLLSATGLTVFSVDSKIMTGGNQTVLGALSSGNFGKIYLGFGLNELGYIDIDSFVQTYCQLIDTVRAAQPQAIIYLQNLIPVNDSEARASGHKGHVNCDRIRLYNELLAQIALEKQLPLLDLYSAFAVDGQLPAEASRDGVHLLPDACKKQLHYFMTHTVTWEQLTAPIQPSPDSSTETPIEAEGNEI